MILLLSRSSPSKIAISRVPRLTLYVWTRFLKTSTAAVHDASILDNDDDDDDDDDDDVDDDDDDDEILSVDIKNADI